LLGFVLHTIYWNDEDGSNNNDVGGVLPDGVYDTDTTVHFCCRQVKP